MWCDLMWCDLSSCIVLCLHLTSSYSAIFSIKAIDVSCRPSIHLWLYHYIIVTIIIIVKHYLIPFCTTLLHSISCYTFPGSHCLWWTRARWTRQRRDLRSSPQPHRAKQQLPSRYLRRNTSTGALRLQQLSVCVCVCVCVMSCTVWYDVISDMWWLERNSY